MRIRGKGASKSGEATNAREHSARCAALHAFNRLGATKPKDIDLDKIAADNDAEIAFDDLEGATARVVRIGERARIVISTRIVDPGSIRFSIAHEIGHLLCMHHVGNGGRSGLDRVCSPLVVAGTNIEREASVFAAELLMPTQLVTQMCAVQPDTLAPIHAISSAFRTSVMASAMRFVELTPERCAVVYTRHGRVQWAKKSPSFIAWIPKGRAVDPASAAFEYFQHGSIEQTTRAVPSAAWLPDGDESGTLYEHATALSDMGAVFSLLWMP